MRSSVKTKFQFRVWGGECAHFTEAQVAFTKDKRIHTTQMKAKPEDTSPRAFLLSVPFSGETFASDGSCKMPACMTPRTLAQASAESLTRVLRRHPRTIRRDQRREKQDGGLAGLWAEAVLQTPANRILYIGGRPPERARQRQSTRSSRTATARDTIPCNFRNEPKVHTVCSGAPGTERLKKRRLHVPQGLCGVSWFLGGGMNGVEGVADQARTENRGTVAGSRESALNMCKDRARSEAFVCNTRTSRG
mmetsp:Transcript_1196/g.2106  ORF Transcript_1196/g.2106 Transcript_1196/m.2106 type:complete len:249 (-) Transcript_1196:2138-2884(-)